MSENPLNFSDSNPAAPAGKVNIKWQAVAPDPNPSVPRDISGYVDISSGGGGSGIVVAGGQAAPQLSARLLGTQVFKSDNTSLAAWTQQTGTHATVDATYNLGGDAYDVIAGAIISVDIGQSLADCAIDFDFLSPAGGGIVEFLFGQTSLGAGPLIQMDGRGSPNSWATARSTTWGNFGVGSTSLGIVSDFQARLKQWNHITLVINSGGTTAALYVNGVIAADAIAITLSGTLIGFWSLAGFGDLEIKDIIVTDLSAVGGGSPFVIVTKSVNYTANPSDDVWASGTINITTPPAAAGNRFKVTNRGSGIITILPASGTINGQASYQLKRQYSAIELATDGTNWAIE